MEDVHLIYGRVSARGQSKDDKESLPDQERYGREFYLNKGVREPVVLLDQFTGNSSLEDRPQGKRLSELIAGGFVRSIYIRHTDRLFRHSGKAINFIDVLVEKGIQVYISGIPKDFSRQEDKFLYSMEAVVAAYERDSILRRTAMGHKKMQDLGRSYSGHIFGYKKELTKQGKVILVPDEVEAPIVRKLFELRAERTPYTKLLKWMNSTGVPTKRGAKAWQSVVVTHMLRNIAYIGKTRNSDGASFCSLTQANWRFFGSWTIWPSWGLASSLFGICICS